MARDSVFEALDRFLYHHVRKHPPSDSDGEFLERFREIVSEHQADTGFTTRVAAASLGMSRMHLNRRLRTLTGQSTHEFIRTMRLDAARHLLQMPLSIGSVAEAVGFKSSSHFAQVFKERFGATPSTYRPIKSSAQEDLRKKSPKR